MVVEDVHRGGVDGGAEGHGAPDGRALAHGVTGGEGGVLGGAVAVDEGSAGQRLGGARDVLGGEGVATREKAVQVVEGVRSFVDHEVEQTRGEPERRDLLAVQCAFERAKRRTRRGLDDEAPPVEQRGPDLEGRGVECGGGEMQPGGARRHGGEGASSHQSGDVAMGDGDALGCASGARRVHDVGEVVACPGPLCNPFRAILRGGGRVLRGFVVEGLAADNGAGPGSAVRLFGTGDDEGETGVFGHGAQTGVRPVGVERHIGAAALEHGEHERHVLAPAVREEADAGLARHTACAQRSRQRLRGAMQGDVRDLQFILYEGDGVGSLGDAGAEDVGDRLWVALRVGLVAWLRVPRPEEGFGL